MRMDAETNAERPQRGNKRKPAADATAGPKEKSHKKPWGTDGPPPPEWIAVHQRPYSSNSLVDGQGKEDGSIR